MVSVMVVTVASDLQLSLRSTGLHLEKGCHDELRSARRLRPSYATRQISELPSQAGNHDISRPCPGTREAGVGNALVGRRRHTSGGRCDELWVGVLISRGEVVQSSLAVRFVFEVCVVRAEWSFAVPIMGLLVGWFLHRGSGRIRLPARVLFGGSGVSGGVEGERRSGWVASFSGDWVGEGDKRWERCYW